MPELKDPPPPTAAQIAKWRREFEDRGREAIRDAIYSGQGIYPDAKRKEAIKWLREKEFIVELRSKKEAVEQLRLDLERAQRLADLESAARLRYGDIPAAE